MTSTTIIGSVAAFALCLSAGCGKDDKGSSGKSTKTADTSGSASGLKELALTDLGLVAMAPSNAKVDAFGGVSTPDHSCTLAVSKKGTSTANFDNVVKNIKAGNNGGAVKDFQSLTNKDADTWDLEWTTEKGIFGYSFSKKIGDTVFIAANYTTKSNEKRLCAKKIWSSLKAK